MAASDRALANEDRQARATKHAAESLARQIDNTVQIGIRGPFQDSREVQRGVLAPASAVHFLSPDANTRARIERTALEVASRVGTRSTTAIGSDGTFIVIFSPQPAAFLSSPALTAIGDDMGDFDLGPMDPADIQFGSDEAVHGITPRDGFTADDIAEGTALAAEFAGRLRKTLGAPTAAMRAMLASGVTPAEAAQFLQDSVQEFMPTVRVRWEQMGDQTQWAPIGESSDDTRAFIVAITLIATQIGERFGLAVDNEANPTMGSSYFSDATVEGFEAPEASLAAVKLGEDLAEALLRSVPYATPNVFTVAVARSLPVTAAQLGVFPPISVTLLDDGRFMWRIDGRNPDYVQAVAVALALLGEDRRMQTSTEITASTGVVEFTPAAMAVGGFGGVDNVGNIFQKIDQAFRKKDPGIERTIARLEKRIAQLKKRLTDGGEDDEAADSASGFLAVGAIMHADALVGALEDALEGLEDESGKVFVKRSRQKKRRQRVKRRRKTVRRAKRTMKRTATAAATAATAAAAAAYGGGGGGGGGGESQDPGGGGGGGGDYGAPEPDYGGAEADGGDIYIDAGGDDAPDEVEEEEEVYEEVDGVNRLDLDDDGDVEPMEAAETLGEWLTEATRQNGSSTPWDTRVNNDGSVSFFWMPIMPGWRVGDQTVAAMADKLADLGGLEVDPDEDGEYLGIRFSPRGMPVAGLDDEEVGYFPIDAPVTLALGSGRANVRPWGDGTGGHVLPLRERDFYGVGSLDDDGAGSVPEWATLSSITDRTWETDGLVGGMFDLAGGLRNPGPSRGSCGGPGRCGCNDCGSEVGTIPNPFFAAKPPRMVYGNVGPYPVYDTGVWTNRAHGRVLASQVPPGFGF